MCVLCKESLPLCTVQVKKPYGNLDMVTCMLSLPGVCILLVTGIVARMLWLKLSCSVIRVFYLSLYTARCSNGIDRSVLMNWQLGWTGALETYPYFHVDC